MVDRFSGAAEGTVWADQLIQQADRVHGIWNNVCMSRRKILWWSLLFGLLGGGAAVVVGAGAWGGTPWRQVPLAVLSMLVGAYLPAGTAAVHRRLTEVRSPPVSTSPTAADGGSNARGTSPTTYESDDPDPSDARVGDAVEFVTEVADMSDGLQVLVVSGGIFFMGLGAAIVALPEARAELIHRSPPLDVLAALPLAGVLLLIGILVFLGGVRGGYRRRRIILDSVGVTVIIRSFQASFPWDDIEDISVDEDFLLIKVPRASKSVAMKINSDAASSEGKRIDKIRQMWAPQSPRIALCNLAALATGIELLHDALEQYSGRSFFWALNDERDQER